MLREDAAGRLRSGIFGVTISPIGCGGDQRPRPRLLTVLAQASANATTQNAQHRDQRGRQPDPEPPRAARPLRFRAAPDTARDRRLAGADHRLAEPSSGDRRAEAAMAPTPTRSSICKISSRPCRRPPANGNSDELRHRARHGQYRRLRPQRRRPRWRRFSPIRSRRSRATGSASARARPTICRPRPARPPQTAAVQNAQTWSARCSRPPASNQILAGEPQRPR